MCVWRGGGGKVWGGEPGSQEVGGLGGAQGAGLSFQHKEEVLEGVQRKGWEDEQSGANPSSDHIPHLR